MHRRLVAARNTPYIQGNILCGKQCDALFFDGMGIACALLIPSIENCTNPCIKKVNYINLSMHKRFQVIANLKENTSY